MRKTRHPNAPVLATPASDWKDVWSRSGSKYRVRAVVLMAVNILLFAGVGCFAYWLRSGELIAPVREGYWDLFVHTFRGVGRAEVSLGSLLVEPISVQEVPVQIPIVGLLMAALISIPILVAILYRFWSSLPLIAVVGFLAVMPWLAVTLLGSCILASIRPLRTRFRFMSALIGLVPTVVYLTLAWSGTADAVAGKIDPVDRVKFVAPWVLAIVASTLVFAVVLFTAKMVDYRPGAVTPLLAVMFLLPLLLFEFHVGRDELYYRLLERLDHAYFSDTDASVQWERAALRVWEQHPLPRPSWDEVRRHEEKKWLFELSTDLGPLEAELTRHQVELVYRCNQFHRSFPDSRHAPNALFIKARALDRRVDPADFRRDRWIRYYEDFPSVASRETWRLILENRLDSPLGAAALLRLAQLEAREGDIDHALEKLHSLLDRFDLATIAPQPRPRSGLFESVLTRESPEVSLRIPIERIVLEGFRLRDLLFENRDPVYGYDALCGSRRPGDAFRVGFLDLDPQHDAYLDNLEAIRTQYPAGRLEDNLELEVAKAAPALEVQMRRLELLLDRFPEGDAAPEALLRLTLAYQRVGRSWDADQSAARLVQTYPHSVWARYAARFPRLAAAANAQEPTP